MPLIKYTHKKTPMNINGNHNILIQSVNDSTITLNVNNGETQEIRNDLAALRDMLQKLGEKQFQAADKIYNIEQIRNRN